MLLALPVLTRLYEPGAFGLLGVYMSLLMILSVSACMRLELAVPLPDDDADAMNLVVLSLLAATLVSVILAVITLAVPDHVVRWLKQPEMKRYLWLVPLGVWFAAVYSALQFWSIRKGRYRQLATTQLTRALGGVGTQTAVGLLNPAAFGLLLGHMFYTGLGSAGLARLVSKHDRHLFSEVTTDALFRNLRKQKRFPLYSVPEAILNTAAISLPIVLIAALVGKQEAGYMLLAQRVTSIPVGLLGGSISRVYLAEAAQKQSEGRLGVFTRRIMLTLLKLGSAPFLLLAVVAPLLFPYIFGVEWGRAGTMVTWLVPYMILQFIASPVSTILHATGNQLAAMVLQIFGIVLLIGSILLASKIGSPYVFESFAVAAVFYYLSYVGVILFLSRPSAGR